MEKRIWMILFLAFGLCFLCREQAEAAVDPDGSVAINEENFPDEQFRSLALTYDANKDAVLSMEERSVLKDLTLTYKAGIDPHPDSGVQVPYTEFGGFNGVDGEIVEMNCRRGKDDTTPLSVKGIEYFPKLRRYHVDGYTETEGSLQNNPELTEIFIGVGIYTNDTWPCKLEDSSRLEQDFPLKQIKKLKIGPGFECKKFSLRSAEELEELCIGQKLDIETGITAGSVLGEVDLSACKKLKKLYFHGVKIKELDLRKNTNLRALEFGGRGYLRDHRKKKPRVGIYYPGEYYKWSHVEKFKCNLKLPPNNQIKNLIWMSDSSKRDLTSCRKLTFLQVPAEMELRFNKKWYQTYGKKKLALYARGTKVRKTVRKKTKRTVQIKTPKLSGYSPKTYEL